MGLELLQTIEPLDIALREEELVPDARARLTPAERVQEKLVVLLELAALPLGHTTANALTRRTLALAI